MEQELNTVDEVVDWAAIEQAKIAAKREEYCVGLESLAAFLRANPDFKLPDNKEFIEYSWDKNYMIELAHKLGHCDKKYSEYYLTLSKSFGSIIYGARIARETVCERKVVGKKTLPGREAYMVPAEPEQEVDVVEWDCTPLLKATEDASE